MKVLYLTVLENTENNNIHENQIFTLRSSNINYRFLFISPYFILNRFGFRINRNKYFSADCSEFKIPICSFNFYLYIVLIPYLFLCTFPIVIYYIIKFKPQIIHCRNLLSVFIVTSIRKIFRFRYSIIADPRSVYPEEGVIIKRWKFARFNYRVWKKIEKWSFGYADACIGLSDYFKVYLQKYNKNSYYIPAVVNESKKTDIHERAFIRSEFGINEDDTVLIYVGSIGLWHDVDLFIQMVERIVQDNNNLKIIALSSSKELKMKLEHIFDSKCVFCGTVPPKDVKKYLSIADFGVLPGSLKCGYEYELLYKTMIASKAEEYLCAGLPIIVNERILNLKEYVDKYNWGIVYHIHEKVSEALHLKQYTLEERERISTKAINIFGVCVVKTQLLNLYTQILH